ncbi:glycosyltransferase family A protein [Aestuariivita sp.]|jgi:glycosyltransferase involved in cell wall biosynthesis|uniref:glycosyltransferase family A protein n=1 Tax=Aestuariivita sp. TaxID=1872407 RepID=UPI00216E66C3|nr:glycosyltransferase family A protein [Aestuariivita sp.]MCE8008762.1 glycosyltransferase family 2 protein [Aestuariivita sp.]
MLLSIIVIFHNMRREAARTLHSLSPAYQIGADADSYEVIAIDNGSDRPLDPETVRAHGANYRYLAYDTPSISPVDAMNHGASLAEGTALAFIVDGARMATPGLVRDTLAALTLARDPFIAALSWHLGPKVQNVSMLEGYDQAAEDALLDAIVWPRDGYRLFEISTLAQSSGCGFLGGMPSECSWLCLPRQSFQALDGYEARFQSGGGGLVNHDFLNRALSRHGVTPIVLLGEGMFHQYHGGVATNVPQAQHPIGAFRAEYEQIRGEAFKPHPVENVLYYGHMPKAAQAFVTGHR